MAEMPIRICADSAGGDDSGRGLPETPPKDKAVPDFSFKARARLLSAMGSLQQPQAGEPDIVLYTIAKFATKREEPADYSSEAFTEIRHWLCRARSLDLPPVMVVCIYKGFADVLRESLPEDQRHSIVYLPVRAFIDAKFVDPSCLKFMVAKSILEEGKTALYSDLDTLWTRNPLQLLAGLSADVALGLDSQPAEAATPGGCLALPRPAELMEDADGMIFRQAHGAVAASAGLLLFRATAASQAALESALMQCQRRHKQKSSGEWYDSDQTALIAGIQPLCGSGLECSFLPVTFGKSTWGPSAAPPHVLNFDAFDDKPFVRYLHLQVEGSETCQSELGDLKRQVHVRSSEKCGGRAHAVASKRAWRIMSNLDCVGLVEDRCYDAELALRHCDCESPGRRNWCKRLRRDFADAELAQQALRGKAWRMLVARSTACVWSSSLAAKLPEESGCSLPASSPVAMVRREINT